MKEKHLAVNGSLMRGFALNKNLISVNATFVCEAKTSNQYCMWSINDSYPAMQQDLKRGNHIDIEIWRITPEALLELLETEPPGLCMGKVQLSDGKWIFGILGESYICEGRQEITKWGGWRKYLANL
jgi:gamma-glutamylcyclotransferase (GGCT)/AIG2-like uncharacterized protein YtfP